MHVLSLYWLLWWLSFLSFNQIDVICISMNRSSKMRQIAINVLPSYRMAHIEQSFSLLSLIFHKRKSQSEAARAEKSKSFWHLNNKVMLVYFLCKKSSVHKRLLWNTCHSPFYWTLLTPYFFGLKVIPLSVSTSPSVLEMDWGSWKGKHTEEYTAHSQMDSSDNKGDCKPWQAELRSLPAAQETCIGDT